MTDNLFYENSFESSTKCFQFFFFKQDLSQKILEIISISGVSIQKDVISCIPEILDDSEHVEIARELM